MSIKKIAMYCKFKCNYMKNLNRLPCSTSLFLGEISALESEAVKINVIMGIKYILFY